MCIDSLIVINSFSLATFPLFVALLYTGKAAKLKLFITIRESIPALKPGRVIRVTFSPGHPGLTRFTIYPGLTRIGSSEKRNCSFDDVETYKRYRVALS